MLVAFSFPFSADAVSPAPTFHAFALRRWF
jgi:hypothetical protein